VQELKDLADEKGIILVSPSSTAGSLAIADDNVFRFCPSDSLEGEAISALMLKDGIKAVVPVWRDDAGNIGLHVATRASFVSGGGEMSEGVEYGVDVQDFSSVITALSGQVQSFVDAHGASSTAVYLAGFDEVTSLLVLASTDPVLSSVRWYGSDGVALSNVLISNAAAAEFALSRGYPCPIFGLEEKDRNIWQPLADRIEARSGVYPDAYALAVYDAAWVIAKTYLSIGGGIDDLALLKQKFIETAAAYSGATGNTALNAAGDRLSGAYDFWKVRSSDPGFFWTRAGSYESMTGQITVY
jgi:branched-chain amino acid transport system substrate-binding protein